MQRSFNWIWLCVLAGCSSSVGGELDGQTGADNDPATDENTDDAVTDDAVTDDGATDDDPQVSNPGELVLTGFSGAGTRSHTAPVWFQDFTHTQDGASAIDVGYQRGAGQDVTVDMSDGLDASSGSLRWDTGEGADVGDGIAEAFPHVYNDLPAGTTTVIRAYYIKVVKTHDTSGSTGAMQLKSFRAGTTSEDDNVPHYSGTPAFKTSLYINADGGAFNSVFSTWTMVGETEDLHSLWSETSPSWHTGGWNHLKVIFVHNTPGSADGRLEYWVNGTRILNRTDCEPRTMANEYLEYIQLLPGFDFKWGDSWTVSYANDYIDTDLARVELTDSADYATSTKWAIQPIRAWSATSITIAVNAVGFGAGESRYFHIFDSTGAHVAVVTQ